MMKVSKMIVPGGDTETPSLLTSCWCEVLTPQHRDAPITRGYAVYMVMGPSNTGNLQVKKSSDLMVRVGKTRQRLTKDNITRV